MPLIVLHTAIHAPAEVCFDLARSVDFHLYTGRMNRETVVTGKRSGLLNLHDEITWRAHHLFIMRELSIKITTLQYPVYFTDEMLSGTFRSIKHEHRFYEENGITQMTDRFAFSSPYGIAGKCFNFIFLANYMKNFLTRRNAEIKNCAESGAWRNYI